MSSKTGYIKDTNNDVILPITYDSCVLDSNNVALDSRLSTINSNISEKYTKPVSGIPLSDFTSSVQTSLSKANTSIQSVKTLKTDNTTAQSTSSSEDIAGSGTINLHKVSKTGSYNDLLNKPTAYSSTGQNTNGYITQKATTDELNLRPKAKDAVSTPVSVDPFDNYYTKNEVYSKAQTYNQTEVNNNFAYKNLTNISPTLTSSSATVGGKSGIRYSGAHIIIESWISSDNLFGYRIWSDGYCEQWGKVVGGTNQINTVSFLKSFREIPQVYVSRIWRPGGDPGDTTADRRQICISNIPTTSSFNIWTNGWNSIDIFWKANGYINI